MALGVCGGGGGGGGQQQTVRPELSRYIWSSLILVHTGSDCLQRYIPLFHTGPESRELTRIYNYLDSWLNRTQFVMVLTNSHSP